MTQNSELMPVKTNKNNEPEPNYKFLEIVPCQFGKSSSHEIHQQIYIESHEGGFPKRMESWHFGGLNICRLKAGRHRMSVKEKKGKELPHRYILLLQRSGISIIQQQGQTFFLNHGQCAILDLQLGFRISNNQTVDQFFLSHEKISNLCHKYFLTDNPDVVFEHNCIFRIFRNFIFEIVTRAADFNDNDANSTASLAHCLFQHALMFHFPAIKEKNSQGVISRSCILQYIECHLANPLLNAEKIAMQFGCSIRTIYRKFNGDSKETIQEYIWRRRLERAALILRSNPKGSEKISAIAYKCGFSNVSHFCDAFKKRFNTTPSSYNK
jgi:AraC-like DNA-binding protein